MDRAFRIQSLDGLRAVSVSMVLAAHAARPTGIFARFDLGNLGVRIFFVISGFLITTLLARELAATGRISLRAFYLRRTLRIFPAFYAFVLVIAAARAAGWLALPWSDVIHAVTYTTNYAPDRAWTLGHTWSLAVEEQFYLLWPAALVFAAFRRGLAIAVGAMVAAPLSRAASFHLFPAARGGIGETFPTAVDAIAAGCVLALARDRLWACARYRRLLGSPLFLAVPLLGAVIHAHSRHAMFSFLVGVSAVDVAIALSVDFAVRFPEGAVGRFLNLRPVAAVGLVSYSIYLWQQPFFDEDAKAWWCAFPQSAILLAACALASYHFIEKPSLRLRAAIEARRSPRPAPPPARLAA